MVIDTIKYKFCAFDTGKLHIRKKQEDEFWTICNLGPIVHSYGISSAREDVVCKRCQKQYQRRD
jgi:hypothetical protein